MLTIDGTTLPLLPAQERFLNIRTRYPALVGGLGAGKSRIGLTKAFAASHQNPGVTGIYACLTYPVLRDAILPEFWRLLHDYGLVEGQDWAFNQTDMTWENLNAADVTGETSKILFRPTDGPLNLRRLLAITAGWAVFDEAGSGTQDAHRRLDERIRDQRCREPFLASVTSPEGLNWLHDFYVGEPRQRAAEAGVEDGHWLPDEQALYVRADTRDNEHVPAAYVDNLLRRYPEHLAMAYVGGHWVPMMEGRVFVGFDEATHVTRDAEYDPALPILMSWDFNVSPMTCTLNHRRGHELWTFGEVVLETGTTEEVCTEFLSKEIAGQPLKEHPSGVHIYGDAGGRSRSTKAHWSDYQIIEAMLAHMRPLRNNVPRSNPSQRDSVNGFNAKLRNGHGIVSYWIHPRATATIKSLLTTVWDENGGIFKGTGAYEHASDTLRYITHELFPIDQTLRLGRPQSKAGRIRPIGEGRAVH